MHFAAGHLMQPMQTLSNAFQNEFMAFLSTGRWNGQIVTDWGFVVFDCTRICLLSMLFKAYDYPNELKGRYKTD